MRRDFSGVVLLQMGNKHKVVEKVGSREGFYKTGEIITCSYADRNDSGENEQLKMEKWAIWLERCP